MVVVDNNTKQIHHNNANRVYYYNDQEKTISQRSWKEQMIATCCAVPVVVRAWGGVPF